MGMAAVGVFQAQGRSPTPTMRLVSETPYPAPAPPRLSYPPARRGIFQGA